MFLVGRYVVGKSGNVYMVLNEAVTYVSAKDAINYADEIGNAYVAQLRVGYPPNVIYESETED